MSLPLIVKSKLFWKYAGQLDCCWYLGNGDGTSVSKQNAYINDMDRFGADAITLNILNEECSTLFTGEFMNSPWHMGKVNLFTNFVNRLKARRKAVVIVFLDGPPVSNAKYPFFKYLDRMPSFIEIATKALSPIVDGFILGIETNRYFDLATVNAGVGLIQKFAVRNGVKLPVGTHECSYRIPANADFIGYETRNHPVTQGDSTSVATMVGEVNTLVSKAGGKPIWVIESNSSEGAQAKAQNRAMAALPGVVGVNMPM